MNKKRIFLLKKDLPFLIKGTQFVFYDSTSLIYLLRIEDGKESQHPIRQGLAGYLWLLCTEKKYMKLIRTEEE